MPSDVPPLVAVVTGSASGIGQAIAIELASRGCQLILHTRSNIDGLMETASQCSKPLCIVADLTQNQSLYSLADAAFASRGYVNLWVHAAGTDVLTGRSEILVL